jgi:hypothetical protein
LVADSHIRTADLLRGISLESREFPQKNSGVCHKPMANKNLLRAVDFSIPSSPTAWTWPDSICPGTCVTSLMDGRLPSRSSDVHYTPLQQQVRAAMESPHGCHSQRIGTIQVNSCTLR